MPRYSTYRKVGRTVNRSFVFLPALLLIAYIPLAYLSNFYPTAESIVTFATSLLGGLSARGWFLAIGAYVVVAMGTHAITKWAESGQWEETGREIGLTPTEEGSWSEKTTLSGRVRGRPVRARAHAHVESSDRIDDAGGGSTVTYTVVEADLDRAADGGVIVNSASGGFTDSAEEGPDAQNEQLAAISDDQTHAEALITGRAKEALLQVDEVGELFVGDGEAVFQEAIPGLDDLDTGLMPQVKSKAEKRAQLRAASTHGSGEIEHAGDEETVTHRIKGEVLDPEKLERQMEAVVTVAEVYEEARKEDRLSG